MGENDWDDVFCERNPLEDCFDNFLNILGDNIEKTVPKYTPRQQKLAPWSNKLIRKLAAKKRDKWDIYAKDRTDEAKYNEYKKALNDFNFQKMREIRKYEQ